MLIGAAWRGILIGVGLLMLDGIQHAAGQARPRGELAQPGQCLATVEYTAITGDPEKAHKSSIYRGYLEVTGLTQAENSDGNATLAWSFTEGETIHGVRNVFKDNPDEPAQEGAIGFRSTIQDAQSVVLEFPTDEDPLGIGFVASKGQKVPKPGKGFNVTYKVGLPEEMSLNDLVCTQVTEDGYEEFESAEEDSDIGQEPTVLLLEYMPIEFADMRFYSGYATNFVLFTIRLKNIGGGPIDLSKVKLEYWFDGGDVQDKSPELLFKPHCMTTSANIDCGKFEAKVLPGLKSVSGAHYKVEIGFSESAGLLEPESGILGDFSPLNNQTDSQPGAYMVDAILNITSVQFFAQMDVTKDYSFFNSTILESNGRLPKELVPRRYDENPRIPVTLDDKIVFGARPKPSRQKVARSKGVANVPGVSKCWFKRAGQPIPQCGLRMRYCCSEVLVGPLGAKDTKDSTDGTGLKVWIVVLLVVCIGFALVLCCACLLYYYRRPQRMKRKVEKEIPLVYGEDSRSDAGSIMEHARISDTKKLSPKDSVGDFDDFEPRGSNTKFHTVPSISGEDSCLLVDKAAMNWDPREMKSWTGYIHWFWEPWNGGDVRRTATAIGAQSTGGGQMFTLSTLKLPTVNVNVNFRREIEPYIGEQLGEGGFGKVFKATFRGQDVAVKVLKVDTEAMARTLEDEIKLSSKMHHENVVKLLAACLSDKDNVCLIMELVDGGNLSKRIHSKSLRRLEYIEVLQIGLDIVQGLAYLHPAVIHRDLKPQNVLLDKKGRAKIADFGISKFKDPHKSYLSVTQTGGTPNYMAPELFNGTRVDEKCDIYSVGCILYEAMSRRVPLSDLSSENCAPLFQIIKTVAIDKRRPKIPENFPNDLAYLIRGCWKDNPASRPSAAEVRKALLDMWDDEVNRLNALRMNAKRKDSSFMLSQLDRRSPVHDFIPEKGRRSLEPGLSVASSGEVHWPQPGIAGRVRSLINGKMRKAAPSQEAYSEVDTFHSAKSSQYFSVEDPARLNDFRFLVNSDRQTFPEPAQGSIYWDGPVRSASAGAVHAQHMDSKQYHKTIELYRRRIGNGSNGGGDLEAVSEHPSPHATRLRESADLDSGSQLEVSAGSHSVRRANSRFTELKDLLPDDNFALELMERKGKQLGR